MGFKLRFFSVFILLLGLLSAAPVLAQETGAQGPYVKLRVLPEYGLVEPGEEIWVAVEQSIAPEWHTYWKNPGDSGASPRVKWSLPSGFAVSDIHWPVPDKIVYGPLVNYGYSDHVTLLQRLTVPKALPPGPLSLKADVEVLVCKEECIPEFSSHEIILNGPEGAAEDNSAFMGAAARALPIEAIDWEASFSENGGDFILSVPAGGGFDPATLPETKFEFFPEDWGLVDNTASLSATLENNRIVFRQKRGERPLSALAETAGLLVYTGANGNGATRFTAQKKHIGASAAAPKTVQTDTNLLQAIIFALLGGLILNLMPCVFPVLSIKALSLVKISEKHPEQARLHGIAYTAGVILSFMAIAAILIVLKSGGDALGWGFQLQNPVVVTLLAYLMFVIGLNLAGFFEISGHFGNIGNKLVKGENLSTSFFTGLLATIVAAPCTAPFMAGAIGYALLQPVPAALTVFAALGFGLAFPYLLLSFVPALRSALPRPGAWMEIFRQLLAFPMFASAAWLVWVLSQQTGPSGTIAALMGMLALAFALWLLSHKPIKTFWKIKIRLVAAIVFLLPLLFLPDAEPQQQTLSFGEEFSETKLSQLLQTRDPVFVEMTAAWCITCKVNHAVAIDIPSTRTVFTKYKVQYLVGDWTNQDAEISAYLDSFGRSGVPLYVYYGAPDAETGKRPEPVVLPQVLTPSGVQQVIEN